MSVRDFMQNSGSLRSYVVSDPAAKAKMTNQKLVRRVNQYKAKIEELEGS